MSTGTGRLPFRRIEASFCAGLLDDPLLLVWIRPTGRSLLFDCGQIHHLAKRVIRSIDAVFVSHGHMDHFMGFDTIVRHTHVAPRTVELYGPPGISRKVASKFSAYDWNLTEPYWCSFLTHDLFPERTETSLFPGPEGFSCRREGGGPRNTPVIFQNEYLVVEAAWCDHKIASLAYMITERPGFLVDEARLERAGLERGGWIRDLKRLFCRGNLNGARLSVPRRRPGGGCKEVVMEAGHLYGTIRQEAHPARIAYVSDIGFTEENRHRLAALMNGATLLVCECSFLAADRDKARASHHLCTTDLNELVDLLRPAWLLPMHLSKSYVGRTSLLYEELDLPATTTLVRLPEHVPPRPFLREEMPKPGRHRH